MLSSAGDGQPPRTSPVIGCQIFPYFTGVQATPQQGLGPVLCAVGETPSAQLVLTPIRLYFEQSALIEWLRVPHYIEGLITNFCLNGFISSY